MHGPVGLTAVPVEQDGSLVDFFEVLRGMEVDPHGNKGVMSELHPMAL